MAPGVSYDKFLKAFDVAENKGSFHYEWFDGVEKLNHPTLSSHEDLYSSMKDCNISPADYAYCQHVWSDYGMSTFQDFLVWYNKSRRRAFRSGRRKSAEDLFRSWHRRFQDLHLCSRTSKPDALRQRARGRSFLCHVRSRQQRRLRYHQKRAYRGAIHRVSPTPRRGTDLHQERFHQIVPKDPWLRRQLFVSLVHRSGDADGTFRPTTHGGRIQA